MLENTNSEGVINETVEPQVVVVNGVGYTEIPKKISKKPKNTTQMGLLMEMYAQMVLDGRLPGGLDLGNLNVRYVRQLPEGVNIIKEFGLIQLKQSKLCRWDRDEVVRLFEANYKLA